MSAKRPQFSRSDFAQIETTSNDDDDDSGLSIGSMIAMAAVFLGCFGGALLFLGDNGPAPASGPVPVASVPQQQKLQQGYVSMVDAQCGTGWKAGMSNVDEMYCYMTTNVQRLCDKDEREHLLATIKRFEKDYAAYNARFNAASMKSIVSVQTQGWQLGMADARMHQANRDPNATPEERHRRMEEVMTRAGNIMAPVSKVQSEKVNQVGYYKLEVALRALVSRGYVGEKDFKGKQPNWVHKGFRDIEDITQSCLSR